MELKNSQVKASPRRPLFEAGGVVPGDLLLHKIEEVKRSVKVRTSFFFSLVCFLPFL